MSVTLYVGNLLESAATVSAPTDAAAPITRLYDGARGPQWAGTTVAPTVTVDLGAAREASGWGLADHNLTGGVVTVESSPDNSTWTARDSATLATPVLARSFATVSARYWRFGLPAASGSGTPTVGELILAAPVTLPTPHVPPGYTDRVLGNVRRDESPAGYTWAVKRGASRREFKLAYAALDLATLDLLRAAFAACDEGAKKFTYVDADGVAWWVEWIDATLEATVSAAVFDGLLGRAVNAITLREAL
jgi:hypothetical protein